MGTVKSDLANIRHARNNPGREYLKVKFMNENHGEIKLYIEANRPATGDVRVASLCKRYRDVCDFSATYTAVDMWRSIQKRFVDPPIAMPPEPSGLDVWVPVGRGKMNKYVYPLPTTDGIITSMRQIDYFGDLRK